MILQKKIRKTIFAVLPNIVLTLSACHSKESVTTQSYNHDYENEAKTEWREKIHNTLSDSSSIEFTEWIYFDPVADTTASKTTVNTNRVNRIRHLVVRRKSQSETAVADSAIVTTNSKSTTNKTSRSSSSSNIKPTINFSPLWAIITLILIIASVYIIKKLKK